MSEASNDNRAILDTAMAFLDEDPEGRAVIITCLNLRGNEISVLSQMDGAALTLAALKRAAECVRAQEPDDEK